MQTSAEIPTEASGPTRAFYADPVDVDGDGDLDLLVGGYAQYSPPAPKLTDEDVARRDALQKEQAELSEKMSALFEKIQQENEGKSDEEMQEALRAAFEAEEVQAMQNRFSELYTELGKLQPGEKRQAGVWFYERLDAEKIGG